MIHYQIVKFSTEVDFFCQKGVCDLLPYTVLEETSSGESCEITLMLSSEDIEKLQLMPCITNLQIDNQKHEYVYVEVIDKAMQYDHYSWNKFLTSQHKDIIGCNDGGRPQPAEVDCRTYYMVPKHFLNQFCANILEEFPWLEYDYDGQESQHDTLNFAPEKVASETQSAVTPTDSVCKDEPAEKGDDSEFGYRASESASDSAKSSSASSSNHGFFTISDMEKQNGQNTHQTVAFERK